MKLSIAARISQQKRRVIDTCVFEALNLGPNNDSVQPFLYILSLLETYLGKDYEDQLKQAIGFYRTYKDFSSRFEL